MTPPAASTTRKRSKSHAAFALHRHAPMLRRCALVLCLVGLPVAARAQTTSVAPTGTCAGMMTGTIGLAVPQSDNNFLTIPQPQIATGVFGRAECDCASQSGNLDINLEIKLTTALPASTAGSVQIWVGDSSCLNVTTRTSNSNTTCEQVLIGPNERAPTIQDFTINSTANSSGGLHYVLKANALSQPFKHMCDPTATGGPAATSSNSVYLFLFTDPNSPLATCSLSLSEQMQGPDPVTNTAASGGDGAVSLTWTPPPQGTFAPSFFQILCSDDCGQPITDSPSTQIYSVCENGMLSRRDLTSGGSSSTGTDGGVATAADMATFALRTDLPRGLPWHSNVDACPADMGTTGTADGGIFGPGSSGPLTSLDPAYICSPQISPSETSKRISGLVNGENYHFTVLSVDAYGNATASERIDGTPQPTEDLWRRYRDAGGGGGGCFIATAAFGSYENRWVWLLRDFRDQVLLVHDSGRAFVEWYYANSPPAAAWIAEHAWARAIVRVALAPLILVAWFMVYVPPWQQALVMLLLVAIGFRKRLRAAIRRHAA
jgi:hypothetical protein